LDRKFQIYDGNELAPNSNSIVWMCLEFDVRIKRRNQFQIMLDVQTIELDVLLILNNIFRKKKEFGQRTNRSNQSPIELSEGSRAGS
jgi:hypothetical protein